MTEDQEKLFLRLETADSHDRAALDDVARLLSEDVGRTKAGAAITPGDIKTTDEIVHLVDAVLPGWTIQITGTAAEPDGHWHCTLRQSAIRDNDEFIGSGEGKILSHALLAALLRTVLYLADRKPV